MDYFNTLLHTLEAELAQQDKLFELLIQERTAIVKLDENEVESISATKLALLEKASSLEAKRKTAIEQIKVEHALETKKGEQVKLQDLLPLCASVQTKSKLSEVRVTLKQTAETVARLHTENAALVRQSLGLICSTLSIMVSTPEEELPTYGKTGAIQQPSKSKQAGLKRTTA